MPNSGVYLKLIRPNGISTRSDDILKLILEITQSYSPHYTVVLGISILFFKKFLLHTGKGYKIVEMNFLYTWFLNYNIFVY